MRTMVLGIDASRNRSGGAIDHMVGILSGGDPRAFGIREVHVWAYRALLDRLPEAPWLVKHNPPALDRSLLQQVWWQHRHLPREMRRCGCDILFASDAGTVCLYDPMVVLSQDALSYEPGMMKQFGLSLARVRLFLLFYIQNRSMRFSKGVIFLTRYARGLIEKATGELADTTVIPHGIDQMFARVEPRGWPQKGEHPVRCVYVSNVAMYKNQWVVVRGVKKLRDRGHDVELLLVGGGEEAALKLLHDEIALCDPGGKFVTIKGAVPHEELPALLSECDLFVFASSCETISITLLEGMAAGLPIACSSRGPMPEVLEDAGMKFDPEDADSVADAVEQILVDDELRRSIARSAKECSQKYTWQLCADKTWSYISQVFRGQGGW